MDNIEKAERRGYARGYTAGLRKSDTELSSWKDRAGLAAERAERAEAAQGIGHCNACAHWFQGDRPQPDWASCAWGICKAPKAAGTPWMTYCTPATHTANVALQTTPHFGCVLFSPSDAPTVDAR